MWVALSFAERQTMKTMPGGGVQGHMAASVACTSGVVAGARL